MRMCKIVRLINIRKISHSPLIVAILTLLKDELFVMVCDHKMIQICK